MADALALCEPAEKKKGVHHVVNALPNTIQVYFTNKRCVVRSPAAVRRTV